jgi:hypothetical protein
LSVSYTYLCTATLIFAVQNVLVRPLILMGYGYKI